MKEYLISNMDVIIAGITVLVTWIFGNYAKKSSKIKNSVIPVQNIIIMIVSCGIYWWATGSFSVVVASGSPVATLLYDTYHSLTKVQ